MSKELIVSSEELSLVGENALTTQQLGFLLKKTPQKYVKERPAKGGGQWKYVSGGYVRKCLNLMFGWDWSFEIMEQMILHGEAIVKGKLTINSNGKQIVKTQFGNKDIICRKGTDTPLSIGNDLKAAATDCLKKCAAELGIAADIYNPQEFTEVQVIEQEYDWEMLAELFEIKKDVVPAADYSNIERIISNKEKTSYRKLLTKLQAL